MEVESLPVFKGPLCLIETWENGKLYVNENVLNQIAQIQQHLNVIAVTGLYRTGKSYLLNRLAGVNRGFPLANTIEPKTKGIWAWCRPHPVRLNEVLLLLDTEGLGDIKKGDRDHDNWIFALAILLSSTIVYNVMGNFDEAALERVSLLTEISRYIKISDRQGSGDFDLFFPVFILTIRDFALELNLYINGVEISSDEYMEDCLSLRRFWESDDKYNKPRKYIREYFRQRKCFTFDRPGSRKQLQNLETLTDADLDEDFIKESNEFTTYVFHNCPPKKLDKGRAVTGQMFAVLTQTYVESIRNGRIPCIENALTTVAKMENAKAVDASVALYVEKMQAKVQLPVSHDTELLDAHYICVKEATALFMEKAIYDQDEMYLKQVIEKMNTEHENLKRKNEQLSESKAQEALTQLYKTIEDKIKQRVYKCTGGHTIYQQDMMKLKEDYAKLTGLGCKKQEKLFKFLETKFSEELIIHKADMLITETERKAEAESQNAIDFERKMEEAKRLPKLPRQQSEDDKRQMAEYIRQLEAKQQEEFKNLKEHYDTVVADRLKEHEKLLKERFNEEAIRLEKQTESQNAIDFERKMEEAKRLPKLPRQQSEDDKRQMAEYIRQLEAKQQEEFKNLKEHYDTVVADRLKEHEKLLKERFNEEAIRLEKQTESQNAIDFERKMEEAKRLPKLPRQQSEDDKRQMAEYIRQLEAKQQEEFKNLKEHYDTVVADRLKEHEKLLKERFNEEAIRLEKQTERQMAIEFERKMNEAKRLAELPRQQSEDDKRQMAEYIRQLEAKQQEEFKKLKKHYDTVVADRLKEHEMLLKERFNEEAIRLEKQSKSLRKSLKPSEVHVHLCSIQ